MDEYITKSDAIRLACEAADEWDGGPNRCRSEYIRDAIEGAAPADVEPVVYCEDCRDSEKGEGYFRCTL